MARRFITNIQQIVIQEGLSIDQIFANFDKKGDRSLDANEFTRIIQTIDGNCQAQVCHQIFQHLDPNNDGMISYKEFYEMLHDDFEEQQAPNAHLVKARCDRVFKNIVNKIYTENMNIHDVMASFDTNRDQQLNPTEFLLMLQAFDPNLTANESYYLFNMFDADNSGHIAMNEFIRVIQ